jgi:aromatic ring hydroxylase
MPTAANTYRARPRAAAGRANRLYRQRRVNDVTTDPAFRTAARAVAAIYDMKADPANREIMSFTEGGDHYGFWRATMCRHMTR